MAGLGSWNMLLSKLEPNRDVSYELTDRLKDILSGWIAWGANARM